MNDDLCRRDAPHIGKGKVHRIFSFLKSASRLSQKPLPIYIALLLCLTLTAGCSQIEIPALLLPATPTSPLPTTVFPTTGPAVSTPTAPAVPTESGPQTLTIWLPPQMDPSADTPAGKLMSAQLAAFEEQEPGVKLSVRVKASEGPGSLLESLSAANAAAPGAMPSLVALTRSDLETAALKGLVVPMDGATQLLESPDWYPYAKQLAEVQGTTFGLPFGGDALLMAYRPARMGPPPTDWNGIFKMNQPVVFPPADPQGLVTLNLYMMLGGAVEDDQRRPVLDPAILGRALKLYADGVQPGVFPYWLSQIQTDKQAWQAYRDQRGQWLITWGSMYLTQLPPDTTAFALPSLGEKPLSLATGWVWALSDPVLSRRATATRLAEYLVEPHFLASWTFALGMLPPRPSALAEWKDASLRTAINPVVLSAQIRPSNDLMASLGPALELATQQVIKRETGPSQAAQAAAERLAIPKTK